MDWERQKITLELVKQLASSGKPVLGICLGMQVITIALGGDLDGVETMPDGFDGVQSYPALARHLLNRGLTEQNVMDIFWNNAIRVMTVG